jgi:hypothetical protein
MDVRRVSVDLPSVIFVLITTHATLLSVSIKQSFLVSQAPFPIQSTSESGDILYSVTLLVYWLSH